MVDFIFGLSDKIANNSKYFMDKYQSYPEFRFNTSPSMGHELSEQYANGPFKTILDTIDWEVRVFGSERDFTNEDIDY